MSDDEAGSNKGGYRIELAKLGRAKCKGPQPCKGTTIEKGEMRLGTLVDIGGHSSFSWRHWGCTTPILIKNLKKKHSNAEDLDGFEDVGEENQQKITTAWEEEHVDPADVPESARKPVKLDEDGKPIVKKAPKKKAAPKQNADDDEEDEEEPKQKKRAAKKVKVNDDDDDEEVVKKPARKARAAPKKKAKKSDEEEEEEKPKRKRAPSKKAVAKAAANASDLEDIAMPSGEDEDEEEEEKPKKKVPAVKKKPVSRAKAKKADSDDEDEIIEAPAGSKRKRAGPKTAEKPRKPTPKAKPTSKASSKRGKAASDDDQDELGED